MKPAILFVDDEALSRKYFKRFFEREFDVYCAENGKAGLALYHTHREEIGIVVTDQMMPEMTGIDFLQVLHKEGAPVARILSTAYADSDEVAAALESGLIEFYITKPWDLAMLEDILRKAKRRWNESIESVA